MTFDSRRVQFLNCNDGDVVWSSDDDDDDDEAHANDLGDLVSDGVGSKSVLRSLSESKTTDWSTTIAAGSTDEVWLQQLDKCECVGFVASPDDDSLCYCGLEKRDHAVSLDEKDSKPQWNRNTNIRRSKTDAVGRIQFQDDALESWFFRLDFETKEEKLHYLLDNILHLSHYNLYIHFLDFQQGHDDLTDSQETQLQERLESGLKTLALRTKLFISSTGLKTGVSRHVHNVLKKLCSNPVFHAEVFRLACAPWGHLADSERSKFIGPASEQVQVIKPGPRDDDNVIGEELSPLFSHYLLFDDGVVSQTGTSSSIKHASSFRRRIKYTLDHLSEDAVSVYVLINGGSETLTHVYKAIRKGHPVIIIQRTGGYADKLARNYFLAQLSVQKFLDETGKIAVRSKLKPAKQLEDIEEEDEEKVRHILEHNNLTVFDPLHQTQGLDMVICQALLKGKQETQLNKLLESFQNKSSTKTAATTQISSVSSQQECFLGSESMQMDFLVEAMLNDSSDVVNVIFKGNLCLVKHFTLCRFCQLYNREQCLGSCLPLLRSANARNVETLGVKTAMFGPSDVRLVLRDLLGGSYPLTCKGKNCPCVLQEADVRSMKYYEPDMYRTCLPPIQELFLWALLTNHQKLAKVFWKHSQDKLASAVVAELLLTRLAGQESNTDRAFKLRENAKEFGDLAEEVLWVCYELDEGLTQKLLTQKSTWWGNKSVIELVYSFRSRSFVSKPACKSLLDKVWRGNLQSDRFLLVVPVILSMVPAIFLVPFLRVNSLEPRGISVPDNRQGKCCQGIRDFYSAPVVKYQLNVVAFLMLLLLFSYVLLVDLRPEFTVCQGVLCGWVFLYTVEEVRQFLTGREQDLKGRWHLYWKEGWNRLDVCTILIFILGMVLVVIPDPHSHRGGRIILSIDFVLFCMRLLQAFAVGADIGPMFTMILKMIRDTVTFVIILMVFILSYAVASEAILFPRSRPDIRMLYYVPRKAYWQIYGDFFLDEIEGSDSASCTNDVRLYGNQTMDRCPSTEGQYIVPILLGGYTIITNVLLLNLLIAKFNDTYANVQGEAKIHWAWYRYQIIYEYAQRPCLPPPLNAIECVLSLLRHLFKMVRRVVCCYCCPRCKTSTGGILTQPVQAEKIGPTSIQIHWRHPEDKVATRYRILCYRIVDTVQGIPNIDQPDLALTLYSDVCTVRNLQPHTTYRFKVSYETTSTWEDWAEADFRTEPKESDLASCHEKDCVEQLEGRQLKDDVTTQLEDISKSVNTNKQQVSQSLQQVTGHITQLKDKVKELHESTTCIMTAETENIAQLARQQADSTVTMATEMASLKQSEAAMLAEIRSLKKELSEMKERSAMRSEDLHALMTQQTSMMQQVLQAVGSSRQPVT
ncbi:transient receptor potential cation channel subfamily M member 4-like isoform X1 [Haliotis rufescens]|uniref:transient receptor potential cation channel subfamily M member 4-like isoform X1 n=1 Tax=Haliotis rufescens TaxID=6454 RepID=UPI00201F6A31|nr:transient receptor potential cation channel subfamily M member 4-like isoform X1 [Haliotis rufescens]